MPAYRFLCPDIAHVICKELRKDRSHGTLADIAQCSTFWNAIAVAHLYREIELDFSKESRYTARRCLDAIIAKPFYCDYIHLLCVSKNHNHKHGVLLDVPLDLLRKFYLVVSLCHNLEEFKWGCRHPIPVHIVKALGRHKWLSRVWILTACCGTRDQYEALESLSRSSQIDAITVSVDWTNWSSVLPSLSTQEIAERFQIDRALGFKKLITTLPKLQSLELQIDHRYIDVYQHTLLSKFVEFESFPRVSRLLLEGWPFAHVGPNTLERRLDPSILQELRLMKTLEIDRLFEVLVSHGTQLKILSVQIASALRRRIPTGATRWPVLEAFLEQQKVLEELILVSCRVRTETAVRCALNNKDTLKKLGVHRHDRDPDGDDVEVRVSFSLADLDKIRVDCGALKVLQMDMPLKELTANQSPYFLILAKFPTLQILSFQTLRHPKPSVARFQAARRVAPLAAAIWCPTLNTFYLDIRDSNNINSTKGSSTSRHWRVMEYTGGSIATRGGLMKRFDINDSKEHEFEIWIRRMARAKGLEYGAERWSREWKRRGYRKALEFFEKVGEEPVRIGRATLMIERVRVFAKEMILRCL